ncbi:uncharacterized protein LOC117314739 isoform X2 [Pecten maximus]|uniref:uncharacterized protein LOC117314739 isoform X2 n=1 Tax=Pecten maximus TaxID=6579 RepID=UPI00145867C0|nr:uncharacterized protein LOC117314739 isoform X2 [Pecten maximus]
MASNYCSSTETTNFARLSRLIVDVCCDVLRAVLKAKIPPPGLNAILQSQRVHLTRSLEYRQQQLLFPPGGVFNGTLEDLDFSLIYRLIRNLQGINIPPHTKGWGKSPYKTDRSLAANIDRLRILRNEAHGHLPTASLSDTDLQDKWDFIRQIIFEIEQGALTGNTYVTAVDNLLTVTMDPDTEDEYIEKLRKQDDFEAVVEDIKAKQGTMATNVSDVNARKETMVTGQETMTKDISNDTARLETIATDIIDVPTRLETIATRQETMTMDISNDTARQETIVTDIIDVPSRLETIATRQESVANDLQIIQVVNTCEINQVLKNSTSVHLTIKPKNLVLGEGGRIIDDGAKQETMATLHDAMEAVQEVAEVVKYMADGQETFRARQDTMSGRQETMANDLHILQGAVSDVTARHNTTARYVDDIKEEMNNAKGRQETLTTDMGNMKAEVIDMKGRQDTLSKDVDTLKERDPKLAAMIETTRAKIEGDRLNYEFIATKSFHEAQKKLKNRMVIIKGNTGDGKSSIAMEILRFLCCDEEGQQKRCLQPLELHDIKDMNLVAPKSGLVIYFDDIFGKNVVCKGDVDEWEKREECILSKFCESENSEGNILVMTIRSEILNSLGSSFSKKIFTEENIVDLSEYKDEEEKRKLLRLYEPKDKFDKWTDVEEKEIFKSCPDIGFPQCCRLFRDTPTLQAEKVNFFRRPFHFVKSCLDKLKDGKFYGLLYLFLNGGKVIENDLDPSNENVDKTLLEAAFAVDVVKVDPTNELVYNKGRKAEFVKESLESLLGSLVKKESTLKQGRLYPCYKFSHDSIEETVALLYGEKTPIGYIQNCPRKLLSYITTKKTTPNRIVISFDDQTNAMCKRIVKEFKSLDPRSYWYSSEWEYLVTLDVWTDCQFLRGFFRYLSDQNVDNRLCHKIKHDLFNRACSTGSDECALFLLSKGVKPDKETPFRVVKGGSVQLLTEILKCKVIPTARADWSRSSNIHYNRNINVLHEACLFEREEMVTMLCDTYPDLVHETDNYRHSTLHFVARTGNCGLFQTVETLILKSLCRVEDVQHKCEIEDGRVVHRSCVCGQYMSRLVDVFGYTILHHSCMMGHRELSLYLCQCYPALTTAVDKHGLTILHYSCNEGHRELSVELCRLYPALTTAVDNNGYNCLHHIARMTSDVDMFTECERHVKQYVEKTGGKYDITTLLTNDGKSVLDLAKEWTEWRKLDNNPLYDHLVQLFAK